MPSGDDFIPEICKIKHDALDKDLDEIKKSIDKIKKERQEQHEEIKGMISKLSRDIVISHTNLKNKIVLVNKSLGDKIDDLNDFDKKLRGNGDPGVWESVRANKESIRFTKKIGYWFVGVFSAILIVLIVITLGGSWQGVNKKSIEQENLFGQKTTYVESEVTEEVSTEISGDGEREITTTILEETSRTVKEKEIDEKEGTKGQ